MKSLLELILEEIEYERLIEEGKNPIELLHYKFQNVPSSVIDKVIEIDPTKKKSYSQWLLSHWNDESDIIKDNLDNGRIEQLFQHYKSHNDIQIKDCPSVEEGLRKYVPEVDTVLTKSSKPTTYIENIRKEVSSELANDFEVVFNEDNWMIAVPNTYEADCKLGENTKWCTANAYGNGKSYYNRYVSDGPLYVNFDMSKNESLGGKEYPFTRYQFHFGTHQFCDAHDSGINVNDTDIPESAMQFYESKGYDTSEFEDLETKIERYEEQRWGCMFRISDDLYLNIPYDDNYEFEEPDENTDFYLYDQNDDRDPISYTEFQNPHIYKEIVVETNSNENYFILKPKYSNGNSCILVLKDENNMRRDFSMYEVYNLLKLGNGIFFGVNFKKVGKYQMYSTNGNTEFNEITIHQCDKLFINKEITSEIGDSRIYAVESIADGYHTLLGINIHNKEIFCIVKRDTPINEEKFTISEDGKIKGKFRSYSLYEEDDYDDTSNISIDLEKDLGNGKYLVSSRVSGKLNILMKGSFEPLLEEWFNSFIEESKYFYVVQGDKGVGLFNKNGKHIGGWYASYGLEAKDNDNGFAFCSDSSDFTKASFVKILSSKENSVIATFKKMLNSSRPTHGIVIVQDGSDNIMFFDYINKQFVYNEFDDIRKISVYREVFLCKLKGEEIYAIYGFKTNSIISQNVQSVSRFNGTTLIRVKKQNGKQNIIDTYKEKELFTNDIDFAKNLNDNIFYSTNEKYYLYNWNDNKFLINPNGFPEPTSAEDNYLTFNNGKAMVNFYVGYSQCNISSWSDFEQNKTGYQDNMTPNVIALYNEITGQQETNTDTQTPSYSVAEEFTRILNKLNEAKKLLYNDYFK